MHDIQPFLPDLFTQPGNLLYVGARPDAHSWLPQLHEVGHRITVLEIWPLNIQGLRSDTRIIELIEGDVRDIDRLVLGSFDYIMWWHGPEHLPLDEIQPTLDKLWLRTRRLLAMACPWGLYPQGAHQGNPYEEHRTTLYPATFEGWGYEVRTDGKEDEAGSEIVAWKRRG